MKNRRISIVNFSSALTQLDAIRGENKGIMYYSTQKERLISYLKKKFPDVSVDLIGLNTGLIFKTKKYDIYRIVRLPNFNLANLMIQALLFNITSFLWLFYYKPSLVYAYTDGAMYPYVGSLIYVKIFRRPFFLELRNPPYSTHIQSSKSFCKRIGVKILDKTIMTCSDKIIHISKGAKRLFKSKPEIYKKSIIVTSCASDIFFKTNKIESKKKDKITFVTWGGISQVRKLDIMIKGFAKAQKMNDKFDGRLLLIGGNKKNLKYFREIIKELKTSDIVFKEYISQEKLAKFIRNNASVAVVPISPEKLYHRVSSPLKLAEAIALELPILASDIEPNQVVKEHELGILCNHEEDSYAEAFLKFWNFSDQELKRFEYNCKTVKNLFKPEYVFKELEDAIRVYLE